MSEFTQTLPESGASRVEVIESLRRVERGVKKRDTAAYLVQIVDKPHQITAWSGWDPLLVFLPIKCAAGSIVKLARRSVEATELF